MQKRLEDVYTNVYLNLETMASKEPVSSTTKEPRPNNPQQAEAFRQETNKALTGFVEENHLLDHYKVEAAYKYLVHKYLNQLLITNNAYYKNASIYPILDTIEDKLCHIMLVDDDNAQCTPQQAQSPDDIETAYEFIHKLEKVEDFGEFSDDAMKAMTGLFNQLQLCHDNAASWQDTCHNLPRHYNQNSSCM